MSHPIHSVSNPDVQDTQQVPTKTVPAAHSPEAMPEAEQVMNKVGGVVGSGMGYFFKSLIRGIGSALGRQIVRSIFGGTRRNRY